MKKQNKINETEFNSDEIRLNNQLVAHVQQITYENTISDAMNIEINYARDCIKTALIINAGAAIAMLALIGNIVAKTPIETNTGTIWINLINTLPKALIYYSIGVILAGISSGLGNISQSYLNIASQALLKFSKCIDAHKLKDVPQIKINLRCGRIIRLICIITIIGAYSSFLIGSIHIYRSLPKISGIPAFQASSN